VLRILDLVLDPDLSKCKFILLKFDLNSLFMKQKVKYCLRICVLDKDSDTFGSGRLGPNLDSGLNK
jgi:hypothetical protein